MLPMLRVACTWNGCRYQGIVRDVRLQPVGVGLVQIPDLRCAGCGTAPQTISGWPPIPEQEEEDDVAKVTVHGGASNAADDTGKEEPPSPGSSSSTSSPKEQTSPEPSEKPTRLRARTTANRSKKARTGSSTAPSTDGGQTEPTSAKTSDDEK